VHCVCCTRLLIAISLELYLSVSFYLVQHHNIAQGWQNVVDLLKKDLDLAAVIETEVRLALASNGVEKVVEAEPEWEIKAVEEALEMTEESFLE